MGWPSSNNWIARLMRFGLVPGAADFEVVCATITVDTNPRTRHRHAKKPIGILLAFFIGLSPFSNQHVLHYFPLHVRQPEVPAGVAVGQPGMIHAELVQKRGMQIVNR